MARSSRRRPLTRLLSALALTLALLLTSVTVQAQSDPTAAQNLRAEVLPGEGIVLSWDAPAEDAESITGYEILRRRPDRGENTLLSYVSDTESNATTYTDIDAREPAEQYVYRVVALRGSSRSGRSNFARVVLPELVPVEPEPADQHPAVPRLADAQVNTSAPSNLVAQATSCSVNLTWDAPTTDTSSVTGYRVLRAQGTAALSILVADTETSNTTYSDSTADGGQTYSYRVQALRSGAASAESNLVQVNVRSAPTATELEVAAVPIVVTSTTAEYFVLYVKHDVDGVEVEAPVAVVRGEAGTTTLSENVAALPKERYRLEKYLIANPADVDHDCTDDITELDNPTSMSPVNRAHYIAISDGAVNIPDQSTFEALSLERSGRRYLKFSLFSMTTDRPRLYFQNSNTHRHHIDFQKAVRVWPDEGFARGAVIYDPTMVAADGSRGAYRFWVVDVDFVAQYSPDHVSRVYTLLAASMPMLTDNLAFWIRTAALLQLQADLPMFRASRMNLVFDQDLYTAASFEALNPGEGYGLLRSMDPDDRPRSRDVVIYDTLPNELPRVGGIISTVPQTPLSHINLRAAQDRIPNAFIPNALDDPAIAALIGNYVHYWVTEDGWQLRAATNEQVLDYYESSRPTETQTPQRDLTVTTIKPLSGIGFNDWDAFGVKAANVAVLGTLGFPAGTVPDGFAIPFYFYDEFMKANGLYDDVREMLASSDFQTDFDEQVAELKKLRKKIRAASTPQWMIDALTAMHATYPDGQSLRYRSSTNNEDLPGFNGAGLYDSQTQKPSETEKDGIDKSLKQAFASLWNFRAFTEREFYRVDHMAAAMGVLVHPNYKDELVNGVAVSVDPAYGRTDSYYFNSQIGEDLVTNPDAYSVPEEVLSHNDGSYTVVALSNQAPSGQLLMTEAQMGQLHMHLTTIHNRFAALYGVVAGEEFAIEIEYKITSDNVLAIKQARPWIFSVDPFISTTPGTGTDNPLTATFESDAQHSGTPFSVEVQFSDNVTVGFRGFKDHGVLATGGTVSRIERVSSRDDLWRIDVIPNGTATVRLRLIPNRPCTLPGALCAYDGRRLLAPVKHIVPGTDPNTAPAFPSPLFTGGASDLSVPEHSFGGTVVGRLKAIDAQDDPLSYSLAVAGISSDPPFEIDAETGSIRVAFGAALDFEQRETYRVTVTATDDFDASITATFEITIEDVNELPVFQSSTVRRYVPEDAATGDPVGRPVTATDVDQGDTLRYSLSGADAGSFEIDGNGQITVASGVTIDSTTQDTYEVIVEAEDGHGGAATVAVTIKVGSPPPPTTTGGGGGGGGPPPDPIPSDEDFDWNVTRDIESLHRDNDLPTGLWSNGEVLWVVENSASGADRLFAYDLNTGERLEEHEFELDARNRFSHGIWSNRELLWIADSGQDKLFAYQLESGERTEERDLELDDRNRDPRGIWSGGELILVLDSVKRALFAYDLESGQLTAEYPLAKLNNSPRGIWSDGFTIWASDDGANRIFAYRIEGETLSRYEDLEFPFRSLLKAGNGEARGIWSDGDVIFVADEQDDQVYTYNLPDAIDAHLASLSLSGVEFGEFSTAQMEYAAVVEAGLPQTTVEAVAAQDKATVEILPADADSDPENGHQAALIDGQGITISVTSADGIRMLVYRVGISHCLSGLSATRLNSVRFVGGSVGALIDCAQSLGVDALYHERDGVWVAFFFEAPEFLSHAFRSRFAEAVPAGEALIASRESVRVSASAAPSTG